MDGLKTVVIHFKSDISTTMFVGFFKIFVKNLELEIYTKEVKTKLSTFPHEPSAQGGSATPYKIS